MKIVRFSAYRHYEQTRIDVSNAIMGLLAGAGMAAHMLQLTEGSGRLLPEIFPRVTHIGRFNLTTDVARKILHTGDVYLGAMAVPYALAIHEDYLRTCLILLQRAGAQLSKPPDDLKLAQQHDEIQRVTDRSFSPASLQQVNTLRLMRNCAIHSGGRVTRTLVNELTTWTNDTEAGWLKLTGRSPRRLKVGDVITFGHGEILIALAATKTLAREANLFLQPTLPRDLWADLVIEDLLEEAPAILSAPDVWRRARGYARFNYEPLKLTETEIVGALRRAGHPTHSRFTDRRKDCPIGAALSSSSFT